MAQLTDRGTRGRAGASAQRLAVSQLTGPAQGGSPWRR